MKIFMVIDSLMKGGTERRMLELIKALSKNSTIEIYLVSLTNIVEYDYVYNLPIKFEIIARKYKKDFSLFGKLASRINKFKPDIIHSWGSMASIFLAPIAKMKGIKFINGFVADAPLNLNYRNSVYLRGKLTYPFSDVVVSNSKAGLIQYNVPIKKGVCIYNGIDFSRFENLRSPHEIINELFSDNLNNEKFIIGMVAAFELRKDYDTFIKASILLCEKHPSINILLIGGGSTIELIKNQVSKLSIKNRILFLGKRSDIESILQIIDVGVLLTNSKMHGEGIANSIIEYMAAGKPVIATRGGGTDEVVIDNENGFLVDYKAIDQVVYKIEYLKNNKNLSIKLGLSGKNLVHNKFHLNVMANEYLKLYNKLLEN